MQGVKAENLTRLSSVRHRFMGRIGGTSPKPWDFLNVSYDVGDVRTRVDENRARICASMQIEPGKLYTAKQTHGTKVERIFLKNTAEEIRKIEADAIWTTEKNVLVGVLTADCVPVLFASEAGEAVGAIHAGWRGAVQEIVPQTLKQIGKELELRPHNFRVAIGPCIGFDAYEVGNEVVKKIKNNIDTRDILKPGGKGRFYFDLAGFIHKQLIQNYFNHVEVIRCCTMTNIDKYFSHRASHGNCGRQGSVIGKTI
jgi:polyphenol oxidase